MPSQLDQSIQSNSFAEDASVALDNNPWKFCVAPMIDVTDRHCRYFLRQLSQNARLYTEMITCKAIIHGDRDYLLGFDAQEHPLALQLAGNDPEEFVLCSKIAEDYAYDEININVGCPSDRVQAGTFGACLMKQPELVAACVEAITQSSQLDCTVKTRIGVDEYDDFEFLDRFIQKVSQAGCSTFIIHARKAILKGLSPKENRTIPPLIYERAYEIKKHYPQLNIILNGGLESLSQCQHELSHVNGLMLGREVYRNPYLLNEVDPLLFQRENNYACRSDIIQNMLPYLEKQVAEGVQLKLMSRHMVGLYHGQHNARHWRRFVVEDPSIRKNNVMALYEGALFMEKSKEITEKGKELMEQNRETQEQQL